MKVVDFRKHQKDKEDPKEMQHYENPRIKERHHNALNQDEERGRAKP